MILAWYFIEAYEQIREKILALRGFNRKFTCQAQAELEGKCKIQCDHCKSYYECLDNQK